jgi:hypothetical protein
MDGLRINAGSAAEGLAMNSRATQGIVDDRGTTGDRWDYPDGIAGDNIWDWSSGGGADRNTSELIAAIPAYAQYGSI